MTASVLSGRDRRAPGPRDRSPVPSRAQAPRRGRLLGIRAGQLVTTQVAAVLVLAGAVYGTITLALATFTSVVLLALAWLRLRGRWAFEWVRIGVAFTG